MDALVAEKVMGWEPVNEFRQWWWENGTKTKEVRTPDYSTDIAAAWQVVERMERRFSTVQVIWEGPIYGARVLIRDEDGGAYSTEADKRAKTAPEAICLAALKAVGVKVPTEQRL